MKKFLTYSVVAATMAWSMGISAVLPAAAAYSPVDGDLIKVAAAGRPGVYYVMGGKKYLFVNRVTYTTWASAVGDVNNSFAGLKGITQTEFDAIDLGGNITARPGVDLIKFDNSDITYAVTPGAKLCKLADAAAKTALYGAAVPVIIQAAFEIGYTKDASCTLTATSKYPDGTLIKSGTSYFYIEGGMKRAVDSSAFSANSFKESWARTLVDTSAYTAGSAVVGKFISVVAGASSAPIVSGNVTVSLAANSPASNTIITGQAIADLAHFNFTGTGTVTGLKVSKIGIASDATLDKIYLYDGNTKITDAGSISNGVISFNNPSGLFTVSGSKVISVKADIAGSSGQTVGVAIKAATDVIGTTVAGSFPINGNVMSVASVSDMASTTLTIGTAGGTVDAGTTNVTLWQANAAVTQRTVKMTYIAFDMVGSAPADALSNVSLYVNGVNVASGVVTSDKVLAFDLGAGTNLTTNGNQLIEVRGAVVKGTDRSFYLSLRETSDIVLVDSSYNVNITAGGTFALDSGAFTINKGTASITTDPNFNTTQIVRTASGQILGQWIIKAYGEDAKVMSLQASTTYTGTAASGDKVNNLAIFVNGAQVGSSQTYALDAATGYKTYGSGNLFTVPAGGQAIVTVKGDLSLASSGLTGIGSVLKIADNQIQGVVSYHTAYTIDNNAYASNPTALEITDGSVTLEKNGAYNNQTFAPNQTVKVGSFVISAGSNDSVRVTNVKVGLATSTLTYGTNSSDLYISENTSNKVSPQASNNFAVDFTLQPNETRTIDVYLSIGNVVAELGNKVVTSMDITARNSSNAIAYSGGWKDGQDAVINTGSLTSATKSADSMSSQYVLGGSSNVNLMLVNFKVGTGSAIIEEMSFKFYGDSTDGGKLPVTSIKVGDAAAKAVSSATATTTVTGLSISVPAGYAGVNVPVSVTYNTVGYSALDGGKYVSSSLVSVKYKVGGTSYTTTTLASLPIVSGDFLMVSTKPVVSFPAGEQPTTWGNGTTRIGRITVKADTSGPMKLLTLPVKFSTSSASFTYTANSLIIKNSNGDTLTATNTTAIPAGATTTIAFGPGLDIAAGGTSVLDVYVQSAAVVGTPSAGTASIGLQLGDKSLFTWTDVNGNVGVTGAYYYNWPVDGVTVSR